jgi:predicted ATPase
VITRLEVDGFKNLLDFKIDFGPFTCLAGPNGVGKSNVFDAIRFLSLLADHTLMEAALKVREAATETSDLRDLFWTDGTRRSSKFRLAADMIVPPNVHDDFGRPAEATSTFLRYEIEVGYEERTRDVKMARLVLLSERLGYIKESEAARRLIFPHDANKFREQVIHNRRRSPQGFISTLKSEDGQTEIHVHQDGGSRGNPQKAPAESAPRTIIGATNTSATPTVLAARREMQRWRLLALEPSAMRCSDPFHAEPRISANGAHLAATVHRLMQGEDPSHNGKRVLSRIAARLAQFVPVTDIRVDVDDVRQLFTLEVQEQSAAYLPARSLSDGTLRFLALCILREDTDAEGLLCMEEPENGIHPARLNAMVDLLRDLTVRPNRRPGPDNPMRQMIVATHSPHFVQLQDPQDLLFAMEVRVRSEEKRPATTIRCRPIRGTWRANGEEKGVCSGDIISYLTSPPEAQLRLTNSLGLELY